MAGATVDTATGITVVFATSSFTAEIKDVNWGGISRESKDTSTQATAAPGAAKFGNMTFMPGDLSDPGELSMEIHFDADKEPPIDQPAETITVTWPLVSGDATAATWAATGFITSFEQGGGLDEVMTGSITVKFSGNVTQVAAA
jgi:hypothetical protein